MPETRIFLQKRRESPDPALVFRPPVTETSGFADVSTAVTLAAPKAGTQIVIPIPYHHKRYMQANFAGTVSAGTVHGFITSGFQDNAGFEQAPSIKTA